MVTEDTDPQTGLPLIREMRANTKKRGEFKALPKTYSQASLDCKSETDLWFPNHMSWAQGVTERYRCWKCGRDLAGWRQAIDRHGRPIEMGGRPAVWFKWFNHLTHTSFYAWWGPLQRQVHFDATHCQDCTITTADGIQVVTCFLGAIDLGLRHAWENNSGAGIDAHDWATHLYRWSMDAKIGSEPIGTKPRANMQTQRLVSPGKTFTSADWMFWCDQVTNQQLPAGVVVLFKIDEIPPGWKQGPQPNTIEKL